MQGAASKAVATGSTAIFAELHEAGSQDGLFAGQPFESAGNLSANQGGVPGDAHKSLRIAEMYINISETRPKTTGAKGILSENG
jgi:hypothetical protein